jgi:outer membrane protein assembly factor BamB
VRSTLCVLLLLVASGCSGVAREPMKVPKFSAEIFASKLWKAHVGDVEGRAGALEVLSDRVCLPSSEGVVCVDLLTGEQLSASPAEGGVSSGVASDGELSYFGTKSGYFYAIDTSGTVRWKTRLQSEVIGLPVRHDGLIFLKTMTGTLVALSQVDGSVSWEFSSSPQALVVRSVSGITVGPDGSVVAGFPDGMLYKFSSATGDVIWGEKVSSSNGSNELERLTDVVGSPLITGSSVCAGTFQGKAACFDYEDGASIWSVPLSAVGSLASDGESIFVTTADGIVRSYDLKTGALNWDQASLKYRKLTKPISISAFLVVGDFEGDILVIENSSGLLAGKFSAGDGAVVDVRAVGDSTIIALTSTGNLSAHVLQKSLE